MWPTNSSTCIKVKGNGQKWDYIQANLNVAETSIHFLRFFFWCDKNVVSHLSSLNGVVLRWQIIFTMAIMNWRPAVSPIILWFTWENMKTVLQYTDHPYWMKKRKWLYFSEDLHISKKIFVFQICLKERQNNN